MTNVLWILAMLLAVVAGWMDWRTRRLPNWLTLSGLLCGLLLNSLAWGMSGAMRAMAGAGLMLAVLLPFVWLRGLGAGDWKLMGALGAILGPIPALIVLFGTVLITALMGLVRCIRSRHVGVTLANTWELIRGLFIFGLRPNPVVSLDNPQLLALPFGVAVALATLVCFWAHSPWSPLLIAWSGL